MKQYHKFAMTKLDDFLFALPMFSVLYEKQFLVSPSLLNFLKRFNLKKLTVIEQALIEFFYEMRPYFEKLTVSLLTARVPLVSEVVLISVMSFLWKKFLKAFFQMFLAGL